MTYFYPFFGLRMIGRLGMSLGYMLYNELIKREHMYVLLTFLINMCAGPKITGIVKWRLVKNFKSLGGQEAAYAIQEYIYHANAAPPS